MLGDLNIAEPKALIGFAGPRVIEQTIRQKLPEGFQRSEFLLEHGMLDAIVDRREMKDAIARVLRFGRRARRPPGASRPRTRSRSSLRRNSRPPRDAARLSLLARTPRDEVRSREHARRSAPRSTTRSKLSIRDRRGHQRQGIGGGDDLRRAPRGRPQERAVYVPAPRAPRGALRHRRARDRPGVSASRRGRRSARSQSWCATGSWTGCRRSSSAHRDRLRAVPAGRRRDRGDRGRAGRPARRHERRDSRGRSHHVDRFRPPGAARGHAPRHRARKSRRGEARHSGRNRPRSPQRRRRSSRTSCRERGAPAFARWTASALRTHITARRCGSAFVPPRHASTTWRWRCRAGIR